MNVKMIDHSLAQKGENKSPPRREKKVKIRAVGPLGGTHTAKRSVSVGKMVVVM